MLVWHATHNNTIFVCGCELQINQASVAEYFKM